MGFDPLNRIATACELGLQEIVSEHSGDLYRSETSRRWLKSKNPGFARPMPREGAVVLSDLRNPTLSIVCEPCGRRGTYNVARLMEQHGDAKLTDLLQTLANCPKRARPAATISARRGTGPLASMSILPAKQRLTY